MLCILGQWSVWMLFCCQLSYLRFLGWEQQHNNRPSTVHYNIWSGDELSKFYIHPSYSNHVSTGYQWYKEYLFFLASNVHFSHFLSLLASEYNWNQRCLILVKHHILYFCWLSRGNNHTLVSLDGVSTVAYSIPDCKALNEGHRLLHVIQLVQSWTRQKDWIINKYIRHNVQRINHNWKVLKLHYDNICILRKCFGQ